MKTNSLKPRKSLGQNFLIDQTVVDKIIDAIKITNDYNYFEIGSGQGALTLPVSKKTNKLIAIEVDADLVAYLKPWLNKDVNLINQDILKLNWDQYLLAKTTVFGNLPYYITTEILEKIFENSSNIKHSVIMIQKDVATKILENKSGKEMSYLGLLINYIFKVVVVTQVSRNSFDPKPNVDSTVIKLITTKMLNKQHLNNFRIALVALLKQRRKTILNNLKELKLTHNQLEDILSLVKNKETRVEALTPAMVYQIVEIIIKD